jgi:hypothetical protein
MKPIVLLGGEDQTFKLRCNESISWTDIKSSFYGSKRKLTALYISGDRSHTPEGTGKKEFLSDYQKKNPPVK